MAVILFYFYAKGNQCHRLRCDCGMEKIVVKLKYVRNEEMEEMGSKEMKEMGSATIFPFFKKTKNTLSGK